MVAPTTERHAVPLQQSESNATTHARHLQNHDVHHVLFNYNYGQYIMLWDHIFGSFQQYNEESPKKKAALGKAQ